MKKKGRGTFEEKEAKHNGVNLRAVKWINNRPVTHLRTYAAANPTSTEERWDKRRKEAVQVTRPNIVKLYNQSMGGVDLLDSLIKQSRTKIRSKKWYHCIVFHMKDFTLVQAWLLYRRNCRDCGIQKKEQLSLLEFKTEVASYLCKQNKIKLKRKEDNPIVLRQVWLKKGREGVWVQCHRHLSARTTQTIGLFEQKPEVDVNTQAAKGSSRCNV
ncbi:UNVERIFIED_CONTAM: hypothetical protein FKN15_072651 [Acipenser sinensis]